MQDAGLVTLASQFSVRETADRFARFVASRGLVLFARVDHAANATEVGLPLRPTELLIYGGPKGGTPLMQESQRCGIDLPLKALIWEDAEGKVWLTYNDARWLAERHGLSDRANAAVAAMDAGQAALGRAATAPVPSVPSE